MYENIDKTQENEEKHRHAEHEWLEVDQEYIIWKVSLQNDTPFGKGDTHFNHMNARIN